jgi:hypothetical protein
MKKIIIVGLCTLFLLGLPFTSVAQSSLTIVKNPFNDPDGPYDGGLDDITDWENLIRGIAMLLLFTANTMGTDFITDGPSGNLGEIVKYIFWGSILLVSAAMYLGEAFDRYEDRHKDGC